MADENLKIDQNFKATIAGVTNDANAYIRRIKVNPITDRLLVENSSLDKGLDSVTIAGYNSSSGTNVLIMVDETTNILKIISDSHHMVHEGKHFMFTDSRQLESGGTVEYLITTPNTTTWAHMTFYLDGSAITQWQFYEDSDRSGGTPFTLGNNNRNSTGTSQLTINWNPTTGGTTRGNLAYYYKGGSTTNQARTGTDSGNDEELILKQNTKYLLLVTSGTAGNLTNVRLEWYETANL